MRFPPRSGFAGCTQSALDLVVTLAIVHATCVHARAIEKEASPIENRARRAGNTSQEYNAYYDSASVPVAHNCGNDQQTTVRLTEGEGRTRSYSIA